MVGEGSRVNSIFKFYVKQINFFIYAHQYNINKGYCQRSDVEPSYECDVPSPPPQELRTDISNIIRKTPDFPEHYHVY